MTESTLGESRDKRRGKSETSPPAASPLCPECGSARTWKDGVRYTRNGDVQRYLCRSCGFRFSEHSSQSQVKVNVLPKRSKGFHPALDLHHRGVVSGSISVDKASQNPSFMGTKDFRVHNLTNLGKRLNSLPYKSSKRRVCVSETRGAKNLAKVEP